MTKPPILELAGVTAGYERAAVLHDVDLVVPRGSVTAVLGPNGAGKTTLLRTAAGLLSPSLGSVALAGTDITHWRPSRRACAGVCLIPEGRGIFPSLTVRENLRLQGTQPGGSDRWEGALAAFPSLRDRLDQRAGTLSGGQQQMVALCRAWIAEPSVILLDEVSMGLAPKVVDEIFTALVELARSGVSLVLVEQYVDRALAVADRCTCWCGGGCELPEPRASSIATSCCAATSERTATPSKSLQATERSPPMRAWIAEECGSPSAVLRLREVPPPTAGTGEIRVAVEAATVNMNEIDMIYCRYASVPIQPPFVPGIEVVGVVGGQVTEQTWR